MLEQFLFIIWWCSLTKKTCLPNFSATGHQISLIFDMLIHLGMLVIVFEKDYAWAYLIHNLMMPTYQKTYFTNFSATGYQISLIFDMLIHLGMLMIVFEKKYAWAILIYNRMMLTYQKTCQVLSDCIINIQAGYICEIECVPVNRRILSLNIQICDKYNLYCTMCGFSVSSFNIHFNWCYVIVLI